MAIVVEEEKQGGSSGIIGILIWIVIIGIVAAAVYYVFISNPGIVEFALPQSARNTQDISKISIKPETVINSPVFRSLKVFTELPPLPPSGRTNPFLPFAGATAGTFTTPLPTSTATIPAGTTSTRGTR